MVGQQRRAPTPLGQRAARTARVRPEPVGHGNSLYCLAGCGNTLGVFIKPQGPLLTADQARALDDDFFTARPFEFFASRIVSLIVSADADGVGGTGSLRSDFAAVVGIDDPTDGLRADRSDREMQLAIDSLAIRHHAAEALVRLYHALALGPHNPGSAPATVSLWTCLANGPHQTAQLVSETVALLSTDAGTAAFAGLVLPSDQRADSRLSSETMARVQLMADWLCHGVRLLDRDDIDINTAHNKLKHGLAVRSRDDLRVTFLRQPLNPDGTVPLSALTSADAIDLIDSVSLDYVSRPRPLNGRKQGLEVATLRLKPATVLAEAWMMALTYGAMFHVAAATHFDGSDVRFSPYPAVPVTPTPDQLLKDSVIGIRRPLTTPPDGGQPDRGPGVAFHEGFVPMDIDHAGRRSTVVADN